MRKPCFMGGRHNFDDCLSPMTWSPERLDKPYSDCTATLTIRMIGDNVKQIVLGTSSG